MCFTAGCKAAGRIWAHCRWRFPSTPIRNRSPWQFTCGHTSWRSCCRRTAKGSVEARVQRINPTGSVVKIGLTAPEHHADINVDLSTARYAELAVKAGDTVWVSPKRVRVFAPDDADYVI